MTGGGTKIQPIVDLNNQTILSSKVGFSNDQYARVANIQNEERLHPFNDSTTMYHAFRRGARQSTTGHALGSRVQQDDGSRPYVWITYNEAIDRAQKLAAGMIKLGLKKGQATCVGIYAKNCPEWVITEQACFEFDMITVPLYDTLGADAVQYIVQQADIRLAVCDDTAKALKLIKTKSPSCPSLEFVVLVGDSVSDELDAAGKEVAVQVISFDALMKLAPVTDKADPPSASSIMTICYTSGTTGMPKGVVVTHENLVAVTTAMQRLHRAAVTPDDTYISFLPLAHMFERLLHCALYAIGGRVGFFSGDIRQLTDDFQELKPTLCAVVQKDVSASRLKRFLLNMAVRSKTSSLNNSIVTSDSVWDKLVFKKIREKMGGNIKLMFTGAAPLGEKVITFIRCALGCVVLEGYGQTECAAACTLTIEGDHTAGHVGVPLPCCEIKLDDVPDMKYYAKDNKGEVCVRGSSVFSGYHRDPDKTAEALDKDGWLHTGDIGEWTNRGTLKIIDRKKCILKLSQGEYVAPEKIENVYLVSKLVAQMFVYGESLRSSLVAIVIPDADLLVKEARAKLAIPHEVTFEQMCGREDVKQLIAKDLVAVAKAGGLHSFEQVKEFHVSSEEFTQENNMLTPTLKMKRPELKEHYKEVLQAMYERVEG